MANVAGAQAQAKNSPTKMTYVGRSRGPRASRIWGMASRQYERAQDVATDAIQETGDAIQRNPLTAIEISFGVGFIFGRAMGGRR